MAPKKKMEGVVSDDWARFGGSGETEWVKNPGEIAISPLFTNAAEGALNGSFESLSWRVRVAIARYHVALVSLSARRRIVKHAKAPIFITLHNSGWLGLFKKPISGGIRQQVVSKSVAVIAFPFSPGGRRWPKAG